MIALTCSPLIDSKWVSPASRIASSSRSGMAPRSPLASVAAIAPGVPSSRLRTCADSRRWIEATVRRDRGGGVTNSTSPTTDPVADSPSNQARRAKLYAPGTIGGDGGISRADSRTRAPSRKPGRSFASGRFTR